MMTRAKNRDDSKRYILTVNGADQMYAVPAAAVMERLRRMGREGYFGSHARTYVEVASIAVGFPRQTVVSQRFLGSYDWERTSAGLELIADIIGEPPAGEGGAS